MDPTHPLYGLTLPLRGVSHHPQLGRVCLVQLYPGVERVLPLSVTHLSAIRAPLPSCRLSLSAVHRLLHVVSSLLPLPLEDTDALSTSDSPSCRPPHSAAIGPTRHRAAGRPRSETAAPILPSQVWGQLSPQQQAQLRQTLLGTLQEVIRHANGR